MTTAYKIRDLSFSYGGSPILAVPELEIPDGKIVALVGPNGSGKTTLLHLLAFIEPPDSGRIEFLGLEASRSNLLELRRSVGLLLQNPYLFHETVFANLTWALRLRGLSKKECRDRALTALETVGLSGFEQREARLLSGGETQRIALARTLALDPKVLLLDEPFNHLDREAARRTEELVVEINSKLNKTVVLTSHSAKSQVIAHTVLHLFKGRIIPAPPDNLFRGKLMESGRVFYTGRILVTLPSAVSEGDLVTIDPERIKVSLEAPPPGNLNAYTGTVIGLSSENGRVRLEIDAGEVLRVLVSAQSEILPHLRLGSRVWI
ncbi:MAG: ABC transporter ATP-binding protein, partial [Desulfomonile tiedjei]|nr:ABC transporter ATP-binding protein [Desulfomonile tiedjei]